ncbi:MAG: CopD family protein [Candidatus Sedimenticola sp. (ex Thyasira tokunagai)]
MTSVAITLHLLGTIVWVGGMFFAHMALRPTAAQVLEPPQRLPLLKGVLDRFFLWVWIAIVLIMTTGLWIYIVPFQGYAGWYVYLMLALGLVMMGLFTYIYTQPYRRMGEALAGGDLPAAGAQMNQIRRIIGINLLLGLITTAIATLKLF